MGAGKPAPPQAPAPTAAEPLATSECVHCGFCLPACPTYAALGTEMDSPRGRLYLMEGLRSGALAPDEGVVRHLDLCLGCRACETECPSGVAYGERLTAARAMLHESRARPAAQRILERAVLAGVAAPAGAQRLAALLLRATQRAGLTALLGSRRRPAGRGGEAGFGRLRAAAALLAAPAGERRTGEDAPSSRVRRLTPAAGTRRARVGLLLGCVGRWMFAPVNAATARVLSAAGCDVLAPREQGCCGALHLHSGDLEGARRLARRNIEAFERAGGDAPLDAIAVNAAGCGSAMKEYGALFAGDPAWEPRARRVAERTRDALELLAELGAPPAKRPVPLRAALHDACHLVHAQRVRAAPRTLLAAVPGLQLAPLADSDRCCGSAGIYNLLHPEAAAAILRPKLARVRESGADVLLAANPGCLMHIAAGAREAGMPLEVRHPIEVLDEACR
jgi:glycolate oxidase iron-sulfur subunit